MAKARTLTLDTKVNVTGADKLDGLGRTLSKVGAGLTAGLTLPLVGFGAAMISAAQDAEQAQAKLRNTFDSMGAAAFTSIEALNAHAAALQDATTFDDESINELQAVLLTFGNVTGDAFTRATAAALDMTALFDGDLQGAAIQLGKALNDPITGLTALTRVGVSFTEQQKEQIRTLQESGDILGAQTIILDELERQFGGTAEALAETVGGKMQQAMNDLGEASEEFGKLIAQPLGEFAERIKEAAKWLQRLNPETKELVIRIGLIAAVLGPALIVLGQLVQVFSFLGGLKGIPFVVGKIQLLAGKLKLLATSLGISRLALLGWIGVIAGIGVAIGDAARTDIQRIARDVLGELGTAAGKSATEVSEATEEIALALGVDIPEAERRMIEAIQDADGDWDTAMGAMRLSTLELTDAFREAVAESGEQWQTYQDQISGVGDQVQLTATQIAANIAEGLGGDIDTNIPEEIVAEVQSAAEKAREAARRIPFEVSQGIIEGRDEVVKAAFQLAEAATDELTNDARVAEARENIRELAEMTAEEIEAATPATEAAREAELAALDIQLAGYLLRADPMSAEAAALLREHLESEDPATKAAADALMSEVEDRAFIMANDVEAEAQRAGISLPRALRLAKSEAATEARLLRLGVKEHIDRISYDGYLAGQRFHESLATGMGESRWRVYSEVIATAAAMRGVMPDSEPKDPRSPLRGITKGFGFGGILAKGILTGVQDVSGAMRSLVGGGMGSLPSLSGAAAGGPTIINNNFTFTGVASGSPNELSTLLQSLAFVSDGSVRYG